MLRRMLPAITLVVLTGCAGSVQRTNAPLAAQGSHEGEPHALDCPQGSTYDGHRCIAPSPATAEKHGWFCNCFREPEHAATSCSRTLDECEEERAAMNARGHEMSSCVQVDEAVCVGFMGGAYSCVATMAECHKVETMVGVGKIAVMCTVTS